MHVTVWNDIIDSIAYQGFKTPSCINNLYVMYDDTCASQALFSAFNFIALWASHGMRQKNNAFEQIAEPVDQTALSWKFN